jgi:hypothetical protein
MLDKYMTFTPDALRVIAEWGEFFDSELNYNSAESRDLSRRIRDHLDKIDEEDERTAREALSNSVKVSPMARQLLNQAHLFSIDAASGELTLHLNPEHKHLIVFQKELSAVLKEHFNNDDFAVTVIVKNEKE